MTEKMITDSIETEELEIVEIAELADGQANDIYIVLVSEIGDGFNDLRRVKEELAELEASEESDKKLIREKTAECEDIAADLAERIEEGRINAECLSYNLEVLAGDLEKEYDIS